MPTFYVSDLDGTLLDSTATLSAYTRETLCRLLAAGLPFTVATSRSVSSVRSIFQGVSLPLPVIELNGAYVSDLATGQHLVANAMATGLATDILSVVQRANIHPMKTRLNAQENRPWGAVGYRRRQRYSGSSLALLRSR